MINLKFLSFFILASCTHNVTSKQSVSVSCENNISIKGYLIRKVKKSETQDAIRNQKLKEEGKSYEEAIDYYEEIFFIPFDSLGSNRNLSDLLISEINFYDEQVFFFPSEETELYITKFCESKISMEEKKSDLFSDQYYMILNNNEEVTFLYKISFVEGKAVHSSIENSQENKIYLDLRYRIKKSLKFFNCFFIYTITDKKDALISDERIKKWIVLNK